ncbi:MAG: ABC transporter permease subunit [Hydrotalea sp.]|nr:ABC transporter permease subunit [Hydrotalea sp.]
MLRRLAFPFLWLAEVIAEQVFALMTRVINLLRAMVMPLLLAGAVWFVSWFVPWFYRSRVTAPLRAWWRTRFLPWRDEWFMPRWLTMWQDEKKRGVFLQVVSILFVFFLFLYFLNNVLGNFSALSKQFSFDFLFSSANYDIDQHMALIPYQASDSNLRAALVGVLGTINVTFWGCILAVVLGFIIALARLSPNFLLNRLALIYIETMRNIPLLIQIIFWNVFLATMLPSPDQAVNIGNYFYLSNDGLFVPKFIFSAGGGALAVALVVMVVGFFFLKTSAARHRFTTGQAMSPILFYGLLILLLALPIIVVLFAVQGTWEMPHFGEYTFEGGSLMTSVFMALLLGLSIFAASYIAETVRGALLAIPKGQTEAGMAIGLSRGRINRLVLIPQTLRMVIPPLSSELIGLLKNSTLAAAIGYVDISTTLASSTLNITGHEMECMMLAIGFYLVLSLTMSIIINYYNKQISLRM